MPSSVSPSPYPSPPPNSCTTEASSPSEHSTMGGNGQANVDGIGQLTYQRAIDIARNTEGNLDPNVNAYLETAIRDIWARVEANPTTYVLTRDEFPVFNYYRLRFDTNIAEQAVDRYWRNTGQQRPAQR